MQNRITAILTTLLLLAAMCATAAAENQPPVAVIENTSTWGETPHDICVTGEYESYDPDGTIVSYDWDFGDGGTSTEGTLWYTYNNSGNYTLSLTVTDNEGATGYAYVNVTIVPGDNPIADNGMKAYVWNALESDWNTSANRMAATLEARGFDVIRHVEPTPTMIYQTISDPDVKVYWGAGHGSDVYANTNNGHYYAATFGTYVAGREHSLTIGVFNHCGDYACYTPGRWLQESTQGNDDVVAQRYFGDGWCGVGGTGGIISTQSFNTFSLIGQLGLGYTYADAYDRSHDSGKKQGNQDLRFPKFCGDVNYDRVVDPDDATLLQNHINDPGAYPIHSDWDADVNGDGSVDIYDAKLLSRHVNDPPAYPLNPRGWFLGTCVMYDTNHDCEISISEMGNALDDWYADIISMGTLGEVLDCWHAGSYC